MMYHFLVPLSAYFSPFNVFRYITFRAVYAFVTALVLAIVFGPKLIDWLTRLKCGQYIHEDVKAHQCKAGTPTMGGLLIAFSLLGSALLWCDLTNANVWLTLFVFVGFGLIGFADDWIKVVKKHNKGLTAKSKFLLQCAVALLPVLALMADPDYSTKLAVPFFKGFSPDLGWFYIPFAMCVIVSFSNGVNLTDGLDGLAIGPTVVTAALLALFSYVAGHAQIAKYLQVMFISGTGEVSIICAAMAGAGLGFLWFNAYPAQVFMGDVGSLSLGATIGFIAVLVKQELVLLIAGGIFVFESLSVILQVGYFKFSGGKRIFRMAPLHHHFELSGIPESKIIIRFWILSVLFALVALSTLKLR